VINAATSSGWPARLSAVWLYDEPSVTLALLPLAIALALATKGVSIVPLCMPLDYVSYVTFEAESTYGAMAFTLIPLLPISFAALLDKPITPCLLAA
jgi:hypothetical protein